MLGSKLIFWGEKKLWNNTLYEEEEEIMVGIIIMKDFKFVLVAEVIIVHAKLLQRSKIFIHIVVTLIQVLQRQTTGIFF